MTLSASLRRFCFAHDNACLIPAETLGEHELSRDVAQALIDENRVSAAQLACLERGFALYWQRCRDLFSRAPGSWFPPRRLNVLIVSDAHSVTPYLDPFAGTSAMLYMSDLDTHPEYVAYLFAHVERLALLRLVRPTLVYNMSWWLERDDASCSAFAHAARQATRPDARVFVLLAEAFDWIRTLLHNPLRPPQEEATEPYFGVTGTDLYLPKRLQPALMTLCDQAEAALFEAMQTVAGAARSVGDNRGSLDDLCEWITATRAHVIVSSADGDIVWTPESTDASRLRASLADAGAEAVRSIHSDLRVVHDRTLAFFAALKQPDTLPRSCGVIETGGGAYVDAAKRSVVYELKQPNFDVRAAVAPPYHRLLLGARVMHEWGHLAHAGKYLRVPEDRKAEYRVARTELGERFMQVLNSAAERVRPDVDEHLSVLAAHADSPQAALARKTLARVGDYLSNVMMSRLLPGEEMQAYVRVNVHHHFDEQLDLMSELARYAYEIHYLPLASLPRTYFYESSRFNDYFIDSGLVRRDDLERLFDAVGRTLACYEVDESKLALPPASPLLSGAPPATTH